jgi:hypothetical protein
MLRINCGVFLEQTMADTTNEMSDIGPTVCNGMIALLDVLGAKQWTIDDAKYKLNRIHGITNKVHDGFKNQWQMARAKFFPEFNRPLPKILTFGDTIAVAWHLGDDPDLARKAISEHGAPLAISVFFQHFFFLALEQTVPLRGAISWGQYITTDNELLGPAVADAASWYDKADWIGIIGTPSFSNQIKLALELQPERFADLAKVLFYEYDVPLKTGRHLETVVVPWPLAYAKCKVEFYRDLAKFPVPLGTEQKYKNTCDFFRAYHKKYPTPTVNEGQNTSLK